MIIKVALKIVKQRTNSVGWTIKSFAPKTLLVASVSQYVVKISWKVDRTIYITWNNINVPRLLLKFTVEFDLDNLALMNVWHRFQMLSSNHIDIEQIITLVNKFRKTFYLIEYDIAFLMSSNYEKRVLSFDSLKV